MWNRVHPETGLAAQLSHDCRIALRVARELEQEMGLAPEGSQRPEHRVQQRR